MLRPNGDFNGKTLAGPFSRRHRHQTVAVLERSVKRTASGTRPTSPHTDGDTRPSRNQAAEPKLPHERDESSNSQQQATPDARIEQAASDVDKGLVDTGLAPVTEELAQEHFPHEGKRSPD